VFVGKKPQAFIFLMILYLYVGYMANISCDRVCCAGEYECGALVKEMNKKNAVSCGVYYCRDTTFVMRHELLALLGLTAHV
jgi:hypothetical protein